MTAKLILFGTGGGPRPRIANSAPAQVIVANGSAYVIDCGNGVARQLAFAGVPLPSLRHVFLTHHHSDHNAYYGNLIGSPGVRAFDAVDAWGPPPLDRMTTLFFEMNSYDIEMRIRDEDRVPLRPLVHVHEFSEGGLVMSDENVKVTATLVDGRPLAGLRLSLRRGRQVDRDFWEDPSRTKIVELAQGADCSSMTRSSCQPSIGWSLVSPTRQR